MRESEPSLFHLEIILEKISEITLQIQFFRNLEDIFQWVVADARSLLTTDRVLIYQFLSNQDAVVAVESVGAEWTPLLGQRIYDPCFDAIWIKRYKQGQTTYIPDVHSGAIAPCYVQLLEQFQVQASLGVPIFSQGTLWGLLIVHHCRSPRDWQPLEVQYLQQIALHLGIAIQQADLCQHQHQLESQLQQYKTTIAEQAQAEMVLRQREEQMQAIAANLPGYLTRFVIHADGTTSAPYISAGAAPIYGLPIATLQANPIHGFNLVHADDRPLVDAAIAAGVQALTPFNLEYRIVDPTGHLKWIHGMGQFSRTEAGDTVMDGMGFDISARKQLEAERQESSQALRRSQHQWYTLFHSLDDFLLVVDAVEGRLLAVNVALEERLGYSHSELLTMGVLDLHPPAQRQEAAQIVAAMLAEDCTFCTIPLMAKDGSQIAVETKVKLDIWEGRPALLAICRDVSDRLAAEAALRQSEAKNRAMLAAIPDLLLRVKRDGTCLDFIPPVAATAGTFALIEQHLSEVLPPNLLQYQLQRIEQALATGELQVWEHQLLKADKWYDEEIRLIPCGTDEVLVVVRDITEQQTARRERNQLEKSLWLANFSLEQLSVSVTWIDRHAKIRRVNAKLCTALGYSRAELQTMSLEQIDPHFLQTEWEQFWELLKQQKHMTFVSEHRTKAGELLPVEVTAQYVEFDGEAYSFAIAQDIRKRLKTEQQLRLQSTALDACADTVMITDHLGIIEWVNPAFTEVTGYSLEEAIGKNPRELVKSGHQNLTFYQNLWATINSGQTWRGEMINRRKDGSLYSEAETITPIHSQQNQISHFIAIKQDITEHKRLEYVEQQRMITERMIHQISQQIHQSLDLNRILSTVVTEVQRFLLADRVLIYRLNSDYTGVVIAESVASEEFAILNLEITDSYFVETRGDTYHDNHINVVSDIYAAGFSPCYLELLESLQVRANLVLPIFYANHIWGLLIAHQCSSPREWQLLEVTLMSQLATQMTIAIQQAELHQQVQTLNIELELQVLERTAELQQALEFEALLKRITDQVRDSLDEEQIFRRVVQELAIAMKADGCDTAIYDADRTSTTVKYEYNQDGCKAQETVYAIADSSDPALYLQLLQGHYCHFCLIHQNVVRPDQPRKTILACPIVDDQGVLGDMWLFKPFDDVFNESEIRLVEQVANQCAIAVRQSRLYQAAQAQVQELERLNQLKDDFLSTVSHELRSPMANIKTATQMLEISLNPLGILDDEANAIHRYFKVLREEGQREINLINDLLDLARLNAETEPCQFITIDLQFYIPHLAEPFIERIHQQEQQLTICIPNHLPSLTTDLSYLERILTELLHNACKYTPVGGTISIVAQSTGEVLEICVSNTGVEIPDAECDRVFDKFYRIPNNDPWKHGGTGLGLALVKKLTEQLGGQIHVESGNQRTTFTLKLVSGLG